MMLVVCSSITCKTVTRIYAGSVSELTGLVGERSEWWPNKYQCPSCNEQATAAYEGRVDPNEFQGFNVRELEAADFFRFMMGVGLPEEQDCRLEVLVEIFKAGKVAKIAGHSIKGTKRYCVDWLEMEDGTKLYFGASAHGATVFRITKRPNFSEQVTGE
jgi:hypothetical protein